MAPSTARKQTTELDVGQALQTALAHHQAMRLPAAEAIYREVLAVRPTQPDALHLLGVVELQRGQAEAAVDLIRRALAVNPGSPAYCNNLGNALRSLGRLDEALAAYRRASAAAPDFADAHGNLGAVLLDLGQIAAARTALEHALRIAPDSLEARHSLGLALYRQARHEAALACFQSVAGRNPGHAAAHLDLALTLLALDRPREAEDAARRACAATPRSPRAAELLGDVLVRRGELAEAATCYRRALALDPMRATSHNNLGHTLAETGELEAALVCLERAVALDPAYSDAERNRGSVLLRLHRADQAGAALERARALAPEDPDIHYQLGLCYQQRGLAAPAEACQRRAVELEPGLADAWAALATGLTQQGRFAEAEAAWRRALAVKPESGTSQHGLSRVKSFHADDPDLAAMAALADRGTLSGEQAIHLDFALGKAYEDVERHDLAFDSYRKANAGKRRIIAFDIEEERAKHAEIARVFSAARLAAPGDPGAPAELPIFVVGMPRSGTTLVEQILASHPDVHGAGELLDLVAIAESLAHRCAGDAPYPACVERAPLGLWRKLGAGYAQALQSRAPTARLVTDKLPENYQRIGLIALMLPRAKIIHCRRDPVDTCLSCYRLLFTAGQRFSYDLAELGATYRLYSKLMAHWREALPGRLLEVRYEDLVADQEPQTRRLLESCGLTWHDNCLAFHKTERSVFTASATQVRRPIYRSSVGRWRRFEAHLGPLLDALGPEHPRD